MEERHVCDCDVIHEQVVENTRSRMVTEEEYAGLAAQFKMFGDGTRVKILHALEQNEMCVCDLAALLDMTKSAISHQLKGLRLSNLVKSRRDGQVIYYSLADDHVKYILDIGFDHIHHT